MKLNKLNKEYLPTKLIDTVRILLNDYREYRSRNNLILAVSVIFNKKLADPISINSFYPLSVKYWKKIIGSYYFNLLTKLIDAKLIESKWIDYVADNGKISHVKGYRINPQYLNDEFDIIKYENAPNQISHNYDINDLKLKGLSRKSTNGFNPKQIKMLNTDAFNWVENNALELVKKNINPDFIDGLPPAMPVKIRIFDDNGVFNESYFSIYTAGKIAQEQGKQLFYFKDKIVIADKNQFIRLTTQNLIYNYKWHINSFHPVNFNLKRNDKTLRVYSQLTSIPTALLPFIRIDGNYTMQADLKCSQFTLFANILNSFITNNNGDKLVNSFNKRPTKTFIKRLVAIFSQHRDIMPENGLDYNNPVENEYESTNNDIYKFLVDALLNDFYGVIRNELELPQRGHAKIIAFRTIFSNPKNKNQYINQFNEIYPSVIAMVNEFKNKHGYNQFAIGLQNVEAEIFIDNIWNKAIQSEINSFTRHDSLIFPGTRKDEVESIVDKVFNNYEFIYKIEYESFNEDEIWDRLMDETNYLDSLDDEFDELFFYTMNNTNKDNDNDGVDVEDDIDIEYIEDEPIEDEVEIIEDIEEEDIITQENYWDHIQDRIDEAGVDLPEEKMNDYYGVVSVDLLTALYELDGLLDNNTRKSLEQDILNLENNYQVQEQYFQDETNEFITRLIEALK